MFLDNLAERPLLAVGFALLLSILIAARNIRANRARLPLPPGPPPDSIFGNTWPAL
jgi:hypothetical protein